ncbi:Hypothetical protein SMAX5B_022693 [Scophthalmus maximus]|uniref:Uncharacterized protein n=1 Tax=Scophthalmus maximus TaxID=52904 RepID=A0A2U9AW74_SCOMX|nr:Hypothetical protein SMAX5B_022693 [Scophthalmus maximus]
MEIITQMAIFLMNSVDFTTDCEVSSVGFTSMQAGLKEQRAALFSLPPCSAVALEGIERYCPSYFSLNQPKEDFCHAPLLSSREEL